MKKVYHIIIKAMIVLLNLIILFPFTTFVLSYFIWINVHLMVNLIGKMLFVLPIPFINIIIQRFIMTKRKAINRKAKLIIIFNIIMLCLNYLAVCFIASMF